MTCFIFVSNFMRVPVW